MESKRREAYLKVNNSDISYDLNPAETQKVKGIAKVIVDKLAKEDLSVGVMLLILDEAKETIYDLKPSK